MQIYNATCCRFSQWCASRTIEATKVLVPWLLDFLQDGLDRGLAPATLRRQVSTLTSVLSSGAQELVTWHPEMRFLWGATNLKPMVVHCYPIWDLIKVL